MAKPSKTANHIRDADDAFDVALWKDRLGMLVRAPARHPVLAGLMFFAFVLAGIAAAMLTPRVYQAEVSILVQKTRPLPGIARSEDRSVDADPMRGVYEEVMRRDNLVAIARGAHLVERMTRPKSGLAGLGQRMKVALTGPIDPMRAENAAVDLLQKMISLRVEGGTFTIVAEWWDPGTCYDLAELARKNFFDERNTAEVAILSDGIALLEQHARSERDAVDGALRDFDKAKSEMQKPHAAVVVAGPARRPLASTDVARLGPDPELTRALEEKRRQIRDLDDDRNRRLADLRSQLAGLLSTYTPAHPSVAAVQSKIDALAQEPPAVRQLKVEERALLERLALPAAEPRSAVAATTQTATIVAAAESGKALSPEAFSIVAPEAALALGALQSRIKNYEELLDRISAAKLDLDVAEKAFKYRYAIFRPAELPKTPAKGSPTAVVIVSFLLGAMFAALASIAADLLGGRVVESWQVEDRFGLRLLGEVAEP